MKDEKKNDQEEIDQKFWVIYDKNTKMVSVICRQLAFGEGAICWFFKSDKVFSCGTNYTNLFPSQINIILFFLILFFLFDVIQYLIASGIYWCVAKMYEKNFPRKNIQREGWMNLPSKVCFFLKLIFLTIASFILICLFIHQFIHK